jgi:hypothetical protein
MLKSATDPMFNTGSSGEYNPSAMMPKIPQQTLIDPKAHPTLAAAYNYIRPTLLKPLLNRYGYGGFQGPLEPKAWHPLVARQLMAGPDRFQKSPWDMINSSGLTGLLSQAVPMVQKFLNPASPA